VDLFRYLLAKPRKLLPHPSRTEFCCKRCLNDNHYNILVNYKTQASVLPKPFFYNPLIPIAFCCLFANPFAYYHAEPVMFSLVWRVIKTYKVICNAVSLAICAPIIARTDKAFELLVRRCLPWSRQSEYHADKTFRPFFLRRLITAWPLLVLIRSLKPCVRFRFRFDFCLMFFFIVKKYSTKPH